jgi:hypothetical protein
MLFQKCIPNTELDIYFCWSIVEKQNNIKDNNMAQVKRYTEN